MKLGYIGLGNMGGALARLLRECPLRAFDFSVSFTLALMHKDVRLATKLDTENATPIVMANVVRELFQTVINEHGADKHTQTLVKLFE